MSGPVRSLNLSTAVGIVLYEALRRTITRGESLDPSIADAVATALKDWAIENGAGGTDGAAGLGVGLIGIRERAAASGMIHPAWLKPTSPTMKPPTSGCNRRAPRAPR